MCQRYHEFEQHNVQVLAIINESRERCAPLKADMQAAFPVLADPDRDTLRAYGAFHRTDPAGRPIPVPGAFLIDAAGIVRYSFVGANPSDRPDLDDLLSAITALS